VSEWAKIWQIGRKQKSRLDNFVIFRDGVWMGWNLTDWSETKIAPVQFPHFSRRCRNGLKFNRLIGNKNRAGGNFVIFRDGVGMGQNLTDWSETKIAPVQFPYFSRRCRNGLKFKRLIGNKNRAGGNFVIFRDGVGMGQNLTDWSETKIAPGAISSFFATVSEWAKIWLIDRKQKSRRGNFVIFRDGFWMG
jgi:hypothetical protein